MITDVPHSVSLHPAPLSNSKLVFIIIFCSPHFKFCRTLPHPLLCAALLLLSCRRRKHHTPNQTCQSLRIIPPLPIANSKLMYVLIFIARHLYQARPCSSYPEVRLLSHPSAHNPCSIDTVSDMRKSGLLDLFALPIPSSRAYSRLSLYSLHRSR